MKYSRHNKFYLGLRVLISFIFLFGSVVPPNGFAQNTSVLNLPVPGAVVPMTEAFRPPILRGLVLYPDNPLKFDFLIDQGQEKLNQNEFKKESTKLIKYFLASLTVPEDQMWVNLSPYEKNRIIPQDFGKTEMGRDLLAQDYMLKQLTASLMNPQDDLGGEFWKRVYAKAKEKYGTEDVPMNTFNKIWIVPEKAVVYEHEKGAFVVDSHLKVMLEEDYLALSLNTKDEGRKMRDVGARPSSDILRPTEHFANGLGDVKQEDLKVISGVQSQIIKEILIPEIEKEVNEGKTFANLRQIYNAVILASWYKDTLKESLLGKVYVDKNKLKGVDNNDPTVNEKIYNQYVESFKKGVYNYIKEDYDPATQSIIPRKYFSGGANLKIDRAALSVRRSMTDIQDVIANVKDRAQLATVDLQMIREGRQAKTTLSPEDRKVINDFIELHAPDNKDIFDFADALANLGFNVPKALDTPWEELVRHISRHPSPQTEDQKALEANSPLVRLYVLQLLADISSGKVENVEQLRLRLHDLNRMILTGKEIYVTPTMTISADREKNLRRVKKIVGEIRKETIRGDIITEDVFENLKQFLSPSFLSKTTTEKLIHIAMFFHLAQGHPYYGKGVFMFEKGNNSLFMNMANCMLRLINLDGISHGYLDGKSRLNPELFNNSGIASNYLRDFLSRIIDSNVENFSVDDALEIMKIANGQPYEGSSSLDATFSHIERSQRKLAKLREKIKTNREKTLTDKAMTATSMTREEMFGVAQEALNSFRDSDFFDYFDLKQTVTLQAALDEHGHLLLDRTAAKRSFIDIFSKEKDRIVNLKKYERPLTDNQRQIIARANASLESYFQELGVSFTPPSVMLVSDYYFKLNPKRYSGLTFPYIKPIIMSDALDDEAFEQAYIHESFHKNAFGFQEQFLEEGMAEYLRIKALLQEKSGGKVELSSIRDYAEEGSYSLETLVITELVESLKGNDQPLIQAYFKGDEEALKTMLGAEVWETVRLDAGLIKLDSIKGQARQDLFFKILEFLESSRRNVAERLGHRTSDGAMMGSDVKGGSDLNPANNPNAAMVRETLNKGLRIVLLATVAGYGNLIFGQSVDAMEIQNYTTHGGARRVRALLEKDEYIRDLVLEIAKRNNVQLDDAGIGQIIKKIIEDNPYIFDSPVRRDAPIDVTNADALISDINLINRSKIISSQVVSVNGVKANVHFVETPGYWIPGFTIGNDAFINLEGVLQLIQLLRGSNQYGEDKIRKIILDNVGQSLSGLSDEELFSLFFADEANHEALHVLVHRLLENDETIKALSATLKDFRIPETYGVKDEFGAYLGEIALSHAPRVVLGELLWRSLSKEEGPYTSTGKLIVKTLLTKLGFEDFVKKAIFDQGKESEDLSERKARIDKNYMDGVYFGEQYLSYILDFVKSLSDGQINKAAQEVFEAHFGKLPENMQVPQKVLDYIREKYIKELQDRRSDQARPQRLASKNFIFPIEGTKIVIAQASGVPFIYNGQNNFVYISKKSQRQSDAAMVGQEEKTEKVFIADKYRNGIEKILNSSRRTQLSPNHDAAVWRDHQGQLHVMEIAYYLQTDTDTRRRGNASYTHKIFDVHGRLKEMRMRRHTMDHYVLIHRDFESVQEGGLDYEDGEFQLYTSNRKPPKPEVIKPAMDEFLYFNGSPKFHVDYAHPSKTYYLNDILIESLSTLDIWAQDNKTLLGRSPALAHQISMVRQVLSKSTKSVAKDDYQLVRKVIVGADLGIHGRVAGALVKLAREFSTKKVEAVLTKDKRKARMDSILDLQLLDASKGSEIKIEIKGGDSDTNNEFLSKILKILIYGTGEGTSSDRAMVGDEKSFFENKPDDQHPADDLSAKTTEELTAKLMGAQMDPFNDKWGDRDQFVLFEILLRGEQKAIAVIQEFRRTLPGQDISQTTGEALVRALYKTGIIGYVEGSEVNPDAAMVGNLDSKRIKITLVATTLGAGALALWLRGNKLDHRLPLSPVDNKPSSPASALIQNQESSESHLSVEERQEIRQKRLKHKWMRLLKHKGYDYIFDNAEKLMAELDDEASFKILKEAALSQTEGDMGGSATRAIASLDKYINHPRAWEIVDLVLRNNPGAGYINIDAPLNLTEESQQRLFDILANYGPQYILQKMDDLINDIQDRDKEPDYEKLFRRLEASSSPNVQTILDILDSNYSFRDKMDMLLFSNSILSGEFTLEQVNEIIQDPIRFLQALMNIQAKDPDGSQTPLVNAGYKEIWGEIRGILSDSSTPSDVADTLRDQVKGLSLPELYDLLANAGLNRPSNDEMLSLVMDTLLPKIDQDPQKMFDIIQSSDPILARDFLIWIKRYGNLNSFLSHLTAGERWIIRTKLGDRAMLGSSLPRNGDIKSNPDAAMVGEDQQRNKVALDKEFANYDSEIYYPAARLDVNSFLEVAAKFPRVSRFVYLDNFIENGAVDSRPLHEKSFVELAGYIANFWQDQLGHMLQESVKLILNPKNPNEFVISFTFNEKPFGLPYLSKRSFSIRYVKEDLFNFNEQFGIVYVKYPGLGGLLARERPFWEKIFSQVKKDGYVVVNNTLTVQPKIGRLLKGELNKMFVYQPSNAAMTASDTKGGIDLNPANIHTQKVLHNGRGVIIPTFKEPMPEINDIEGIVPNIINIVPATNLPLLLGIAEPAPKKEESTATSYNLSALPVEKRKELLVGP